MIRKYGKTARPVPRMVIVMALGISQETSRPGSTDTPCLQAEP